MVKPQWLVPSTFGAAFLADAMFTITLIVVLRRSRAGISGLKRSVETHGLFHRRND